MILNILFKLCRHKFPSCNVYDSLLHYSAFVNCIGILIFCYEISNIGLSASLLTISYRPLQASRPRCDWQALQNAYLQHCLIVCRRYNAMLLLPTLYNEQLQVMNLLHCCAHSIRPQIILQPHCSERYLTQRNTFCIWHF